MSTVRALPEVTVWWIITPFTGPQAPLLLRLWLRQLPTSTTVTPSSLRALRNLSADMGGAMPPPSGAKRCPPGAGAPRVDRFVPAIHLRQDREVPTGRVYDVIRPAGGPASTRGPTRRTVSAAPAPRGWRCAAPGRAGRPGWHAGRRPAAARRSTRSPASSAGRHRPAAPAPRRSSACPGRGRAGPAPWRGRGIQPWSVLLLSWVP